MFWGASIKPNSEFKVDCSRGNLLHLSQACLADLSHNERSVLQVREKVMEEGGKANTNTYTLAILQPGKAEMTGFDIFFQLEDDETVVFINKGKNEIHLTGFCETASGDDEFDEMDSEDEEMEGEMPELEGEEQEEDGEMEDVDQEEEEDEETDDEEDEEMKKALLDALDGEDTEDEEDEDEEDDEEEQEEGKVEEIDEEEAEKIKSTKTDKNATKADKKTSKAEKKDADSEKTAPSPAKRKATEAAAEPSPKKEKKEDKEKSAEISEYVVKLTQFLKEHGKTPLAKIGCDVKKPAGIKKIGAFIKGCTEFTVDDKQYVNLA